MEHNPHATGFGQCFAGIHITVRCICQDDSPVLLMINKGQWGKKLVPSFRQQTGQDLRRQCPGPPLEHLSEGVESFQSLLQA